MKMISQIFKKVFLLIKGISIVRKRGLNHNQKLLQDKGNEALLALKKVENETNTKLIVMFGTLLGAYREHNFIVHDDDLDVMSNIQYLSRELLNSLRRNDFKLSRVFVASDRRGVQLPMNFKGLTCDIYFYYENGNDNKKHIYLPLPLEGKDWNYSEKYNIFSIKDVEFPLDKISEPCEMNGLVISIPSNTEDILKTLYGETFMTPKENAHANPPVDYYKIGEKYYTSFPIELFETSIL